MPSIYTRKGEEILIDDEDLDFVSQFTWSIDRSTGYPRGATPGTGHKSKLVYLHQLLRHAGEGHHVDHVNGNKRDARQKNLERVTHTVNNHRKPRRPSTGVVKYRFGFASRICVNSKVVCLGTFKTFDLALLSRIVAEIRYWGEPTQQMP